MMGGRRLFGGSGFGRGKGWVGAEEPPFTAVEQLPLNLFSRFPAEGGRQGYGEVHLESGFLSAGADHRQHRIVEVIEFFVF
jgi:hypothetical protein